MQKVKIGSVRTKSGEGGDGKKPWTLVIVTGDDGSEFTSFDRKLEALGPGSVIEIDPEIVNKNGKTKVNIKDYKVISEVAAAQGPGPAPGPTGGGAAAPAPADPSTVLLEIDARARATALILSGDLAKNDKIKIDAILSYANSFYSWLKTGAARASTPVPTAVNPPKASAAPGKSPDDMTSDELAHELFDKKEKKPRDASTIKNLGELFQACLDDFHLPPDAVAKELGYSRREDIPLGKANEQYMAIRSAKE